MGRAKFTLFEIWENKAVAGLLTQGFKGRYPSIFKKEVRSQNFLWMGFSSRLGQGLVCLMAGLDGCRGDGSPRLSRGPSGSYSAPGRKPRVKKKHRLQRRLNSVSHLKILSFAARGTQLANGARRGWILTIRFEKTKYHSTPFIDIYTPLNCIKLLYLYLQKFLCIKQSILLFGN